MATKSVVSATYKSVIAILEANDVTLTEFISHALETFNVQHKKTLLKIKELEDQVFHFTKEEIK